MLATGLAAGLAAGFHGIAAQADVLAVPQRGQSQAAVLREFGEPQLRHAPAGGGAPKHPPITRWDYDGWSVFFERTTVVDVVIQGDPPPLSHVDELHPARAGGE
ncbi:MAG: hypothetical protein QM661_05600 [Solimonas sp.]